MIVIIPHPTEELKLIRFQKELISKLNTNDTVFYAHTPLWIDFYENNSIQVSQKDLKTLSQDIKKITASALQSDDKTIYLQFNVETKEKACLVFLPLLHLYKGNQITQQALSDFSIPVKELKIFRLGSDIQLSPVSKAISKEIWKKL